MVYIVFVFVSMCFSVCVYTCVHAVNIQWNINHCMTMKLIWVTSFGSSMQYMAAEESINSCSTGIVK